MLNWQHLSQQIPDFSTYQTRERQQHGERLERALACMERAAAEWSTLHEDAADSDLGLVAGLLEQPDTTYAAPDRPTPITVVATDGSQIYPDRHVEPLVYLLNISRIAFQYGTHEAPLMEAVPTFRYRKQDLADLYDDFVAEPSPEVVSALRDELELSELYRTAWETRIADRPIVAMADGTLIRWMIRGMQNRKLEERLINRYIALLDEFQNAQIPLCSYISMPGNTEVVHLLRVVNGETKQTPMDDPETLLGLRDRHVFERLLGEGERTAVFEAGSRVLRSYGDNHIVYFYCRVPTIDGTGEVGRVEFPRWMLEHAGMVELLHSVVLSECKKGMGYPMILSEAHERAVIRAQEKEIFFQMLGQELHRAGLPLAGSQKATSKRRPIV